MIAQPLRSFAKQISAPVGAARPLENGGPFGHTSSYNFTMFQINGQMAIPDDELIFTFARSGGPGGQNVNKVASKAVLRWSLAANVTIPAHVLQRLRNLERSRITTDDEIVIQSQEFRDQERNKQACLEKLRDLLIAAATLPKPRRPSKPTRGSKERRLKEKKHRANIKSIRQSFKDE